MRDRIRVIFNTFEFYIDLIFLCGMIQLEVKSVLVKVTTVQTCGDWPVFCC